jgi:hypothetical protein
MKKSTLTLSLIFLALLISCKKNKTEPIPDVANVKQKYLKSVTMPNGGFPLTETFQYDTLNRTTQVESKNNGSVAFSDYRYITPTLIEIKDKQSSLVDSLFLDDRGLVVKQLDYYKKGVANKTIYEYDAEKRLKKRSSFLVSTTGEYKLWGTLECSYTGSKLIKTTEITNNEQREFTHTINYEYANDIKNTISYGHKGMFFMGIESAFLPTKTVTEHIDKLVLTGAIMGRTSNEFFNYKLDKDGYVSQVFINRFGTFDLDASYEYF